MSDNRRFLPGFPVKPILLRVNRQGTFQRAVTMKKAAIVLGIQENFRILTQIKLQNLLVVLLSSS